MMSRCPVCETENNTLLCKNCGFDGSCNYESYPSLTALRQTTDAISKKRAALEAKPEPVRLNIDDYIQELPVMQKIREEQKNFPKPPAPKPDTGKKSLLRIASAIFLVLMVFSLLAALLGNERKPKLDVAALPIREEVKALIAAGTEDTYTYMDGSVLELYFDSKDLENARIYKDSEGCIAYVFTAEYDADGNILIHQTFDSTGTLIRTDSYQRDQNGDWTDYAISLKDGIPGGRSVRRLTPEGGLEYGAEYAADGSLVKEEQHQFDEAGDNILSRYLDGTSYQYTIDKDGYHWTVSLDAEGNVTDKLKYRLNENDQFTEGYNYDAEGKLLSRSESIYDDRGNEIGYIRYHADDSIEYRYEYTYDTQDNRIITRGYNPDGSMDFESTAIYGPGNVEIGYMQKSYGSTPTTTQSESVESILGDAFKSITRQSSGAGTSNSISLYDAMGNQIRYISYDQEGRTNYEIDREYDLLGNMSRETDIYRSFHDNGKLRLERLTVTDALGNSTETIKHYNEDGTLNSAIESEKKYDTEGNSVEIQKRYDPDGKLESTTQREIQTDSNGNSTELYQSHNADGILTYESVTQKDPQGNYTETVKSYHDDGSLFSVTEEARTYKADGSSVLTRNVADAEGRETESTKLKYDADNKAVSGQQVSTKFRPDGTKLVTTYDHNHEEISRKKYDVSGKLIFET